MAPIVPRQRPCRGAVLLVVAAATGALVLGQQTFVNGLRPSLKPKVETTSAVTRFGRMTGNKAPAKGWPPVPWNDAWGPVREDRGKAGQSGRSKAKNAKKSNAAIKWPIDVPLGTTVLHVEFDDKQGAYKGTNSNKGNPEVTKLYSLVTARYGQKIRMVLNHPRAIRELQPGGGVGGRNGNRADEDNHARGRPNALEVTDIESRELLFSKLESGNNLFVFSPEMQLNFFSKLDKTVAARQEAASAAASAAAVEAAAGGDGGMPVAVEA
mmetsp:Transcript_71852/g.233537  ORF Transcript_71852/g.233537 Transcript_71852/m.233537 type:complete len:268 (-) Transcript_71852:273-1076(-)